ncbi:hydroxyethylthiazole kinase [Microbacterium resistens]|uniref:Hydroxyethylthiazole kinase n=1 Tax=Microbacterium resistens TaxID=156977 RepID=A0ABU1S736_9MICO|nr:hydroxyethylthiazole kinase [Microbacterium resistens]MDR6865426.1 hydroxyethylthiazole kinase [Microbacterium resistens]
MSDRLRPPSAESVAETAADLLTRVRDGSPVTHCITNSVVTWYTANVLLAIGAAPAMVDIVGEARLFAGVASGVLINLGTPLPEQRAASIEAADGAVSAGTPWVLDPVAIGVLPVRTALAADLLGRGPSVIRGNASEILALAGIGRGGRGVDATSSPDDAAEAAASLAMRTGGAVAVSGEVDLLTDGVHVVRIANGDPLLTRITGGGCALGAVMAAFLGAAPAGCPPLLAAAGATLAYTVAAEDAAAGSPGPGTFAVRLLDALSALAPEDVVRRARVRTGAIEGAAR